MLTITVPTSNMNSGYCSPLGHRLTEEQRATLTAIVNGLRQANATLASGATIDSEWSAIQWILENGAEA